jgi:hypothetical protein
MSDLVSIRYIGVKPLARGTVANRKDIIWQGRGDVQDVDSMVAKRLLDFPTTFILASDKWVKNADMQVEAVETESSVVCGGQIDTYGLADAVESAEDQEEALEEDKPEISYNEREEGIIKAIKLLDPDNPNEYSSRGKPKVSAVNAIFSEIATAAEIESAYKQMKGE